MKNIVKISPSIVGKTVTDVILVFDGKNVVESSIKVDDGSSLRIDPVGKKNLFVCENPSGKCEWSPTGANVQALPTRTENPEAQSQDRPPAGEGSAAAPCSASRGA